MSHCKFIYGILRDTEEHKDVSSWWLDSEQIVSTVLFVYLMPVLFVKEDWSDVSIVLVTFMWLCQHYLTNSFREGLFNLMVSASLVQHAGGCSHSRKWKSRENARYELPRPTLGDELGLTSSILHCLSQECLQLEDKPIEHDCVGGHFRFKQ